MRVSAADPGFGLYIHWPFCRSKCPYCDFNSHVREQVQQARWRKALLDELNWFAARAGSRHLTSIFFGGGTPSLMPPETVAALIARARQLFSSDEDLEVTLEANPTSAEAASFKGFAAAGVNRLSMGLQALDDDALKFLGREHSVDEALGAFALARQVFSRVSFDMIYARPQQTLEAWTAELDQALGLAVDHLSLYQLTIEANTGFAGRIARGDFIMPVDETQAALFEVTQKKAQAMGLPAYEISNHAKPGMESRHNLTYWRYGEYLGIGPGAHGRFVEQGQRLANQQLKKPELWLEAVETRSHGTELEEAISPEMAGEEMLMMGLRLVEGVHLPRLEQVANRPFGQLIAKAEQQRLSDTGLLQMDGDALRATAAGRQVLNAVLARLLI